MTFSDLHFLRPYWLIALLPLGLMWWRLRYARKSSQAWSSICDAALLPHVLVQRNEKIEHWRNLLVLLSGLSGIVALAGPTWSRLPQPVYERQSALVIALDLSLSMQATDVAPSRVERARFKIADILQRRKEGQTALIVFAEEAFTVTPLTEDTRTILNQLPVLTPAIMPAQGSRPDRAIELGRQLLRQSGLTHGDILLLTDGIEADMQTSLKDAVGAGPWRVSVLGVGTSAGAPVPAASGGFVQDARGEVVMAAFDPTAFLNVAEKTGGIFAMMIAGDQDVERLEGLFRTLPNMSDLERTEFNTDRWYEQGPWLVLIGLLLAAAGFRRGYLVVLLSAIFIGPQNADAAWVDWWLRADQQGQRAMEHGDNVSAERLFQNNDWKGAAQYRNGHFTEALNSWSKDTSTEALYNKGNALAQLGRYDEAIKVYDDVLSHDPKHEDARFNRELLAKLKQDQQQQQSDGKQSQEDKSGQKSNDGNQSQDSSSADQQRNDSSGDPSGKSSTQEQQTPGADPSSSAAPNNKSADFGDPQTPGSMQPLDTNEKQRQSKEDQNVESVPREVAEGEQADEQWLRRVPDDPGGLLRRKFHYQYRERNYSRNGQGW